MANMVSVPDRTVVLTFDDSVRSHLTNVAPLLRAHGFGATFFVTHAWMEDTANYLNWTHVAELDHMGFEIGNHTWSHTMFSTPDSARGLPEELARVEHELAKVGVECPVSFCWPGNQFGPEALAVLRDVGYKFARRGPWPDIPSGAIGGMGPLYDPHRHDPLLIPSSGLATPELTPDDFRIIVDRAKEGKIVVFQFHGVPDDRHPFCSMPLVRFREFMDYLSENDYCVIALRDVDRYIDPSSVTDDPIARERVVP